MKDIAQILEKNGFIVMSAEANRVSLNKGYTENGFADKVFHVHLRYTGDNDELYFRDYLNEHSDVAKEYEALKLRLWKQYEHNRDAYTDAKTDFISKWTAAARKKYGNTPYRPSRSTASTISSNPSGWTTCAVPSTSSKTLPHRRRLSPQRRSHPRSSTTVHTFSSPTLTNLSPSR